ncbi:hypothetical protein [Thiohalospira sp.]|uniref:hypothetical protein n=1 Tax=Thiohalospira sp. TaxID=3080549 RepID=UPI00398067F7
MNRWLLIPVGLAGLIATATAVTTDPLTFTGRGAETVEVTTDPLRFTGRAAGGGE